MEDRLQVIVEKYPEPVEHPQNRYPQEAENRYPAAPYRHPKQPLNTRSYNPSLASIIPVQAVEHQVHTREGMNVDLTCLNTGSMPSNTQVVWTRVDGGPIAISHKMGEGVLHIRGAKKSDEGMYLCQLIEHGGSVLFQLNANLVVQGDVYINLRL